ncbi:MAG: orotidine 5-phosphate decarboxylase [Sulfitobacter sp.]
MYTRPIQLSDVRYNAATQSFEATVTVYDKTTQRTYACAINAPISMSFEQASEGLTRQALRRHTHRGGMSSAPSDVFAKPRAPQTTFDPVRWLETLIRRPEQRSAA